MEEAIALAIREFEELEKIARWDLHAHTYECAPLIWTSSPQISLRFNLRRRQRPTCRQPSVRERSGGIKHPTVKIQL